MWYKLYQNQLRRSPSTVAQSLARHLTFGRSRVLTPVPPDQVWVFFKDLSTLSHRGMSHITDKAIAGSVSASAVPTTFIRPIRPIHTIPIPNLSVNQSEGALECLQQPAPLRSEYPFHFLRRSRDILSILKKIVSRKSQKKYLTLKM
jgi:hypothetical protein